MAREPITVAPGELVSITNLLWGFLQDLTPGYPDDLEDIIVDQQILVSLMALADAFVPKNENETMELAYVHDTLEALCHSHTHSSPS